jgi:hypothetical protein
VFAAVEFGLQLSQPGVRVVRCEVKRLREKTGRFKEICSYLQVQEFNHIGNFDIQIDVTLAQRSNTDSHAASKYSRVVEPPGAYVALRPGQFKVKAVDQSSNPFFQPM